MPCKERRLGKKTKNGQGESAFARLISLFALIVCCRFFLFILRQFATVCSTRIAAIITYASELCKMQLTKTAFNCSRKGRRGSFCRIFL